MTITFTPGTITSNATEQTVMDVTADEHFAVWIFTHNMQSGDTVVIKVYVLDQQTSTLRLYTSATITNAQSEPSYFVPFIPTKEFKITLQRTAGTDRVYTWQRAETL